MKTVTREPQKPESYATFWEPIAVQPARPTTATPATNDSALDAYLEFMNVTEDDSSDSLQNERI